MQPQSPQDLIDREGLDERQVVSHFLFKTTEQAYEMFRRPEGQLYLEDLTYMSLGAFEYYLPAAIRYVEGEESNGDAEFVSWLLGAVLVQATSRKFAPPLANVVRRLIEVIRSRTDAFGFLNEESAEVDREITGILAHLPRSN
jgi:hypothetical protein